MSNCGLSLGFGDGPVSHAIGTPNPSNTDSVPFDPDAFLERCAAIDGATLGDGAFAAVRALWVGRREVAHFDDERALDVRLTKRVIREQRAQLRADERVALRASASDWIELRIENDHDADWAYSLVQRAVAENLPSAPPGPPPTGGELERRRRFH